MSEQAVDFFGEVLQRHLGPQYGTCPQMSYADLEKLLTDDAHARLLHLRRAAAEWADSEIHTHATFRSERCVITPRGLLYAGELRGPRTTLCYLATPHAHFEPTVGCVAESALRPGSVAAVDSRLDHDLIFTWPLDRVLRRMLDAAETMWLDPAAHS